MVESLQPDKRKIAKQIKMFFRDGMKIDLDMALNLRDLQNLNLWSSYLRLETA